MLDFKTTDLCDDHSNSLQICDIEFRSFGRETRFSGKIETVNVFEDNVLVVEALENVEEGSVVVVDGHGSKRCALLGDRLAGIAESRKLAGIIINGYVRDSAELAKMNVGILALGTYPLKSKKAGKGERNGTLYFGGIEWKSGEYVYADEDGVIVSEQTLL
ncbi:ribonuclease E activity regulator RraA [Psychrobacillus sp. NEAU-3TGS]|uniref:ribonuclease E activity regulator RraA n=1 Tax=Psychrobacillus sp. NEAU-3TGS TaxID=2995412 RepID=UPI002499324F|nr:ribonuclease E activity regulator RraA [Psychrobacillus sp. NEAU-3TGS]MDI2585804.1 ribonuclease E activity regulator RraA [Psychrobacillus sp. NEAU-3TGS]